jgi:hypothetical protein
MATISPKCLVYFVAVVIALGSSSPASADEEATRKAVIRAWKKKEQETSSFRFEWTNKVIDSKENLPVPAKEDVVFQGKSSIIVSGSRMSTSFDGPSWVQDRFLPQLHRNAFDGNSSKSLRVFVPSERKHPIGDINSTRINPDANSNFCIPIQLAFRAFHPVMGRFDENKLQVINEKCFISDKECIQIDQKKPNYVARCWVDPKRDYAIVRYAMVFDGFPTFQCDVEYKRGPKFGWVPESWHSVLINRHSKTISLDEDHHAQVTNFEINGPVEDYEFQLEFPPGTVGMDWINDQRFVVLGDGTIRVATRAEDERGMTYDELLHSETKTWGRNLLTAASIAILGMILGLLLLKVRRKWLRPT